MPRATSLCGEEGGSRDSYFSSDGVLRPLHCIHDHDLKWPCLFEATQTRPSFAASVTKIMLQLLVIMVDI
eukprot:scaffold32658_cov78-Skeletonema_dohrnii-CCMP3373.AAC.2